MAHINLLPWREELRTEQKRQFGFMAVGGAIFAGLVVMLIHQQVNGIIEYQNQRNRFIETQIKVVDEKIKEIRELTKVRKNLIARMKVIEELQSSRPLAVHLFEEMAVTMPEGVSLIKLSHNNNQVTINGEAQSNARVSIYMRNLDESKWLTNPQLSVIQTQGSNLDRRFVFDLTVTQTTPSEIRKGKKP